MKASKYDKCKYPPCNGSVTGPYAQVGLCNRHGEQLEFLLWALNVVKMSEEPQPEQTDSTIKIK
jgi:hypothetical protein